MRSSGKSKVHTFLDAGDLGRLSQTSKHMLSLCYDEVSVMVGAHVRALPLLASIHLWYASSPFAVYLSVQPVR